MKTTNAQLTFDGSIAGEYESDRGSSPSIHMATQELIMMKNKVVTQPLPEPGACSSASQVMRHKEMFYFDGVEGVVPADARLGVDEHLYEPVKKLESGFKWGFHFAPRAARESILKDGLKPPVIDDVAADELGRLRAESVYFYTTPVIEQMMWCGDLMTRGVEYDLWLVDISEVQTAGDECIYHAYHHMHVDGECRNVRSAVRTLDYKLCKPVSYIEVPEEVVRQYAMNGFDDDLYDQEEVEI